MQLQPRCYADFHSYQKTEVLLTEINRIHAKVAQFFGEDVDSEKQQQLEFMMPDTRRAFLKASVALSAYSLATVTGLISPATQADWLANLFVTGTLDETVKKTLNIDGITLINASDKIDLKLPSIAENGAVVPITVTSSLNLVEQIFMFVEKNPVPLAAVFDLSPEVEAFVSARLKIAETCDVIVVAKAAGKYYKNQQTVKVTIGGCGG